MRVPGSARALRAQFGASPNCRVEFASVSIVELTAARVSGEAPETAREARALPGALTTRPLDS